MKRVIIGSFFAAALLFVVNDAIAGSIEYYGSKAGFFRPCKGEVISVCKKITTDSKLEEVVDDNLVIDDSTFMLFSMEVPEEKYVIVEYDGVEYQIPVSWIDVKDGSITPQ